MTFVLFVLGLVVAAVMYYIGISSAARKRQRQIKALQRKIAEWEDQRNIYADAEDWAGVYRSMDILKKLRSELKKLIDNGNNNHSRW